MKTASIRELKHDTSAVLNLVSHGESVEIRRRNVPVAVLSPIKTRKVIRRDFRGRLKDIYGDRTFSVTGTDLISEERGDR